MDDDPWMGERIRRLLSSYSVEVLEARDGETALRMVRDIPDLVVLDVMMTGLHGLHVLERMRRDPATQRVPVMVCTHFTKREILDQAQDLGACEIMDKIFDHRVFVLRTLHHLGLSAEQPADSASGSPGGVRGPLGRP